MAQGEFTKEEAYETEDAVKEIVEALSKKKKGELFGHINDIYLFIAAAKRAAPTEAEFYATQRAGGK